MAQSLDQIIGELDASYNPSRQTINDRINGLQAAEDADLAALKGEQQNAFDDITNNAISRGVFYGGAPIAEQQRYTSRNFLPAVAKVKQQTIASRSGLVDALNNLNTDQRKTAMSIRETQLDRDFQAEQAAAARRAEAASSNALSSLFSGAGKQQTDPFAQLGDQKQQAFNAMEQLLRTNNPATIKKTFDAITASANKGNMYDKYKLELLKNYQQNSSYGNLIKQAMNYRPAQSNISIGPARQMTLR